MGQEFRYQITSQLETVVRGAFPVKTFISLNTIIRNPRIATQEELMLLMTLKLNVINIQFNRTVRGVLTSIYFGRKFFVMTLLGLDLTYKLIWE